MEPFDVDNLTFTEAGHLPIIKEYAKRIALVDTVDRMVDSQMALRPGLAVLAMVIDTLSGRSPLYRLIDFYDSKDIELLLGSDVAPELFSDYNLGRALDKIHEAGTEKIFSQIAQNALDVFDIDTRRAHFDTTSISVYGDYDVTDPPFKITYGHSKDKRPDLKQFLISMLCVDHNIPVFGAAKDGNASDKTINNELLSNMSTHMATHGLQPGAYLYVADSAFVTEGNLEKAHEKGVTFLTRLPATYGECGRVIQAAVEADAWVDVGRLAQEVTKKRPQAHYRAFEGTVTLYDRIYRAIVVHSSAHDKRRHKRIDRLLDEHRTQLEDACKQASTPFFCRADAEAAGNQLKAHALSIYHRLEVDIEEVPRYPRGRPVKGRERIPERYEYVLKTTIHEDPARVEPLRTGAGCFVLLTNMAGEEETWSARELLSLYKDQNGIEKNFGFLKDPVIVNSLFLKKPERIEVLGLVLLIALLIWRLMEHSMRRYLEESGRTITGWEKRQTKKPTSFMMTTKFASVLLVKAGSTRSLARPLKQVQLEFLKALNVSPTAFTVP
jgi:transposase